MKLTGLLGIAGCAAGLLSTGCGVSVVGHWRMVKAIPNRDVFAISDASFTRDGRFSAAVTIDGRTTHEMGVYDFSGFKLTMHPEAGGEHRYNATVRMGTLEVLNGERKVILQKTGKPNLAQGEEGPETK